jgi:GDSL-like Lipase/Acylhydrolase family
MMPPEQQDQHRQLEALKQYVSKLGDGREDPPPAERPPDGRGRLPWRWGVLALVVVAAVAVAGTLVGRALRSGPSGCATDGPASNTIIVGDSMSTVTAPAGPNIAFPLVTGRLLGWQVQVVAHPDTGFTTPGGRGPGQPSFASTVDCVIKADPRIVIVALGSDDAVAGGAGNVEPKATKGLSALHRRLKGTQIVAVGPLPSGGEPSPALRTVRDAVRAAAQAAHVGFIDPLAEGWISGDRTDPASGNANQMISADGRHLTSAGHAYVGLRLATDLSRLGVSSR